MRSDLSRKLNRGGRRSGFTVGHPGGDRYTPFRGLAVRKFHFGAKLGEPLGRSGKRAWTEAAFAAGQPSARRYTGRVSKTFYIETFGCQMNAHDSEKVIGTLEQQGYAQVQDEAAAGLILYNTCSIRDKAEQKVFHRLNEYKRMQGEGKKFAVLGCVAQQEGEKIFEKAPYVSIVSGSASYRNLPQMLQRLEAGETRITGLDDRQTEETFETEFTSRSNPHRGYITIIEGCDKFCAYCVVPYTRGKERSPDVGVGAGRGAADGRCRGSPRFSCWGRT